MNDQTMNNGSAGNAPEQSQQTQTANEQSVEREIGERPIRTIKDGAISASVWERQSDDGPQYSAKVVRKWRDEEGRFHESNNYSEYDLSRLADVARNTCDVILGLQHGRERSEAQAQDKAQSRDAYIEERQNQPRQQSPENARSQ